MRHLDDDKTAPLDLGADVPPPAPPAPPLDEAAPGVPSITQARKEARLAEEFDLVRVTAPVFILDKKAAATRSANAERVAKHRGKMAAEGKKSAAVPSEILNKVKAAGGWDKFSELISKAPEVQTIEKTVIEYVDRRVEIPGPERIINVPGPERIIEKPAQLSQKNLFSLKIGRAVQNSKGWRRKLLKIALGADFQEEK